MSWIPAATWTSEIIVFWLEHFSDGSMSWQDVSTGFVSQLARKKQLQMTPCLFRFGIIIVIQNELNGWDWKCFASIVTLHFRFTFNHECRLAFSFSAMRTLPLTNSVPFIRTFGITMRQLFSVEWFFLPKRSELLITRAREKPKLPSIMKPSWSRKPSGKALASDAKNDSKMACEF